MKRMAILLSVMFCSVTARSQVIISLLFGDKLNSEKITFGLLVGNGWNNQAGYKTSSWASGFNLGLYLGFKMSDRIFLQFDAMAKYKLGAKELPVYSLHDQVLDSLFATGSVERSIKYLSLAPTFQYRIYKYFNLELGPQISLRLKALDVFSVSRSEGELKFEKKVKDATTLFDVGAAAGISYQFAKGSGVKIAFRYYYGFVDIMLGDVGNNANRSLQVNGYIPIGRAKALAKKSGAAQPSVETK